MDRFQNKYRIPSARLQDWNYGWDAAYFITICSKNREHYFGNIVDNKIILTSVGIIADVLWHEIKNHAQNIELNAFVVMPNHIHGIVILDGNNAENTILDDDSVSNSNTDPEIATGTDNVGTRHALSLHHHRPTIGQQRFQNQGKNTISSIIGSYKSAVTKHANRLGLPHGWQPRFYDHIIRNENSFKRIQNYIENNPANWNNDKFKNAKEDANG